MAKGSASKSVITRFAPSPTGRLHIGGARTALFCWALANQDAGRFVLRIEDTDQARSSAEATEGILEALAWLSLNWDEGPIHRQETPAGARTMGGDPRGVGPFHQSQRREIYEGYFSQLLDADLAYHAFETPEELEEKRRASAGPSHRYDRAALQIPREERIRRAGAGEPHVLRLRAPEEPVKVVDEILGEVTVPPSEIDDFIIRKRDGFPTYHFAVVVDDALMGVTHVIRGQEHLANTPRHVALQEALGFRTPKFAHLPLIFNADGSKMSKRDKDKAVRGACKQQGVAEPPVEGVEPADFAGWLGDAKRQLPTATLERIAGAIGVDVPEVDVEDFRAHGYLPEVVCNYIALLGFSPGEDIEKFDLEFLKERFDLKRVGKTNARFDRKKLLAFNTDAISAMDDTAFRERWRAWCERYRPDLLAALSDKVFSILATALRPRSKTLREAADGCLFATRTAEQIEYEQKAVEKALKKGDQDKGVGTLRDLREALAHVDPFDGAAAHAMLERFASEREIGMGRVAQPLRVALTGTSVSPPIDATIDALGREECLKRIDRCLRELS